MKRTQTAVAISAAMFAMGCANEEIDATPSTLTFAAQACKSPESAPTPELAALARDVNDYSTNASNIVARTIEACTNAAIGLGVDLSDGSLFVATDEWYAKAASEIRRRCSAIEAPLLAANPMTTEVALYGCESPDACVDPLVARERCKDGHVFVRVISGAPESPWLDSSSSLEGLLYFLPQSIRTAKTPSAPGPQTYAPSPRATLCDQTIRESASEATGRWAPALAAAAEALDGIARASRVQTTCTVYSMPAK